MGSCPILWTACCMAVAGRVVRPGGTAGRPWSCILWALGGLEAGCSSRPCPCRELGFRVQGVRGQPWVPLVIGCDNIPCRPGPGMCCRRHTADVWGIVTATVRSNAAQSGLSLQAKSKAGIPSRHFARRRPPMLLAAGTLCSLT